MKELLKETTAYGRKFRLAEDDQGLVSILVTNMEDEDDPGQEREADACDLEAIIQSLLLTHKRTSSSQGLTFRWEGTELYVGGVLVACYRKAEVHGFNIDYRLCSQVDPGCRSYDSAASEKTAISKCEKWASKVINKLEGRE